MSEYQAKIKLLHEKISKLKEQEASLVKKRKTLIGNLAEQLNLLTFSDACLAGILISCKEKLHADPHEIKNYEEKGKSCFIRKRKRQEIVSNLPAAQSINSFEATHG